VLDVLRREEAQVALTQRDHSTETFLLIDRTNRSALRLGLFGAGVVMRMIICGSLTPLKLLEDMRGVRRREIVAVVTTTRAGKCRMSVETARHTAWRALRKAAGLAGFRFHDLRHTVVTDLLEAGEPEHVIEAVTGHLSRRMLEHYSHQRLKAKGQMLTRMEERRKKESA
jgi:site-specific recombinase XerD